MNVNLYGCRGQWLMVDLGLTFADPDYPGIDLILPDLEFIEEQQDRLAGIVLTHGHEDHIGALPYLAADLNVPLYATPFTAGLIAGKLEEEGLTGQVQAQHRRARRAASSSARSRSAIVALAHSIPEGNGAADRDAVRPRLPHRRLEARRDAGARRAVEHRAADAASATRACSRWSAIRPTSSRRSRRAPKPASTTGLLEQVAQGARAACWSPPSRPTPRGCRRSARSRPRPAAGSASPAARSTASSGSRRPPAICAISPSRFASTKRCGCRAARC